MGNAIAGVDVELHPTLGSGGGLIVALVAKESSIRMFSNVVVSVLRGRWV